jgi:hypothetical protein
VTDVEMPSPFPKSSDFKYSKEMNRFVQKVRTDGLDPEHKQHIRDFDLSHKDAFRTVSKEEWNKKNE